MGTSRGKEWPLYGESERPKESAATGRDGDENPLIRDLVAQVQSLEERIQLQQPRSDLVSRPH